MNGNLYSECILFRIGISNYVNLALCDILLEYFEIYIHQILYYTKLYPKEIFERRVKYRTLTMMSRHPELNTYIYTFVQTLKPLLTKGILDSVDLIILNSKNECEEKFVLKFSSLKEEVQFLDYNQLDSILRASILRISLNEKQYKVLNEDCSFKLYVHVLSTNKDLKSNSLPQKIYSKYIEIQPQQKELSKVSSLATLWISPLSIQLLYYS